MDLSNTLRAQLRRESQSVVSECWLYTAEHGIQEVTVPSAQATLTIGGHELRPWCLLNRTILGGAPLIILYSIEAPSRELRERVTELAARSRRQTAMVHGRGAQRLTQSPVDH